MSTTDCQLKRLLEELDAARKAGETIWALRNECFYKLRETAGEVEREILKTELKKLNALCANSNEKCRTLHSLYTWWLYQLGIDDYDYGCGYNGGDCS